MGGFEALRADSFDRLHHGPVGGAPSTSKTALCGGGATQPSRVNQNASSHNRRYFAFMATANEIAGEARAIETSPTLQPGSQPAPLIVAEMLRNLASLVADLAERVEQVERRGS